MPPTPSVAGCGGLGQVDAFQNITPPGVSAVLNVLVDPVTSGTIYAGTDRDGIWKSTNCGSTWTKVNIGLNPEVFESGGRYSMAIDPVDPHVLYAGSLYGNDPSLQRSNNGGQDWRSLSPTGSQIAQTVDYNFMQEFSLHPRPDRNGHLLQSFHADCNGSLGPMCLAESFDGGQSWRLFEGPTGSWVEDARPFIIDEKTMVYATFGDGLYSSSDSGATWAAQPVVGGNHQMIQTAQGVYSMGAAFHMIRSSDGVNWRPVEGTPAGDG